MEHEQKCYAIVDRTGNYYRLDGNQQLVVAKDDVAADVFDYNEAVERIGTGRKAQFYNIVPLKRDDIAAATSLSYNLDEVDWLEYMKHFLFIRTSVDDYEEKLRQSLSDVDMEICDIMHCVELCQLTDLQSLDIVDRLRDCRARRRWIKDKMYEVEWYQKAFEVSGLVTKVKESVKQISKLERRTYKPRKLQELFARNQEPLKQAEEIVHKKENVLMERERKETVFDGKNNDWLEFAKAQLLFFGNVKQYIINLELDMEQLDREIDELLIEIEDANYNVAQGYKVFKRLKDLRVERREKDKEWQCLRNLSDGFDCMFMEDSFRYSVGAITEILAPVEPIGESVPVVQEDVVEELVAG